MVFVENWASTSSQHLIVTLTVRCCCADPYQSWLLIETKLLFKFQHPISFIQFTNFLASAHHRLHFYIFWEITFRVSLEAKKAACVIIISTKEHAIQETLPLHAIC